MQEKIKKLSESIKERVLEKRLGKSEIQENSYHAEEHEGKWVIKDEAGYIMTTDKFDTKEEAEADIAKYGQPKEQILPVENARVKRVVESLDKVSKILKDRATEKGWLNLSKEEIDKKIKELQKKGWYDEYTLDMTLLYHLKDVGNTFSESKINEGNYDYDNAWLGFCTNVKRYSTGNEVSLEDAIEAELDDLVYTSDIINIWKDMPGNLGSRINEITDLMRQDIQEGAFEDVDFISGLEESKMNENHKARKSMKKSVNEDNNLQQIFDDAFSGGTIPAFETANGVMYLEPQGDKIIIGGATNTGVIPQYEFEYDFSQSFDWNIQGMIEQVYEQEGYPEEEWNEDYKGKRTMKKSVNENMSVAKAKKLYKKHGMLFLDDEEGQEAYDVLYNAGYTMKKKNDVAYCVEFDRMRESLERRKSAKKSVNEISIEKAKAATETRKQRMVDLGAKYGGEMVRNYRSYHDRRVKPSKLSNEEVRALGDKWHDNERKYLKDRDLLAKKQAKSESLAETLLREVHSVLTMNENESSELTTWQFTARGFSKAMVEKQSVFGSANIRCIIHENADGKVVGTAVADYYMDEVQVEEAIKKALAENGFKATSITDLVNLY